MHTFTIYLVSFNFCCRSWSGWIIHCLIFLLIYHPVQTLQEKKNSVTPTHTDKVKVVEARTFCNCSEMFFFITASWYEVTKNCLFLYRTKLSRDICCNFCMNLLQSAVHFCTELKLTASKWTQITKKNDLQHTAHTQHASAISHKVTKMQLKVICFSQSK